MRGAWLDDNDPVGRHSPRHDGAARWQGVEVDDPDWVPPSLRGQPGHYHAHADRARTEVTGPPAPHNAPPRNAPPYNAPPRNTASRNVSSRNASSRTGPPPARRGVRGQWLEDVPRNVQTGHDSHRGGSHRNDSPAKSPQPDRPAEAPSWTSALTAIGALFALGVVIAGAIGSSETRAAAVVMVVLGFIFTPILKRLAGGRRDYQQILYAGLAFKLTMTVARFYLASGGYYKNSDAYGYDFYGRQVASDYLKHGHMPPWKSFTGTAFLRLVTGFVYTIMPASELAAFFVFAAFSFAGALLFWRAVQRFAPPPSDRTYLLLLMFVPSFVYWPAALGKEGFIILCLGLTTYGFSSVLTSDVVRGITYIAGGVAGMTMVRPHVGVAVMIGLTLATLLARQQGRRTGLIAMGILLIVGSGFVISRANSFFNSDITSAGNVTTQLQAAGKRTTQGGSEFSPTPVSPQNFPFAVVTVLIRPFPWESSSLPEFATALESMVIAWLIIKGLKNIRGRVRRDNPLALYGLVCTLVFVVLFWNFGNFGILARQRTQIAPFMFMLLAMPVTQHLEKKQERRRRRSGKSAWDSWDAAHGEAR